jgi:hypothetical protein
MELVRGDWWLMTAGSGLFVVELQEELEQLAGAWTGSVGRKSSSIRVVSCILGMTSRPGYI